MVPIGPSIVPVADGTVLMGVLASVMPSTPLELFIATAELFLGVAAMIAVRRVTRKAAALTQKSCL